MSGYADISSPFPSENALWRIASGAGALELQKNALFNQGAQQDLTDRATLRGLAPGLATRDPNAVAGAAVLSGGPVGIAALTGQDDLAIRQQELGLKLAMIRASQSSMDAVYPGKGASAAPADLGPFEQQMGAAEAPNPSAVNKGGYIGQFQFGAPRLAELGIYSPPEGENVKANTFGGSFNIPGFPNVKTKADFLASPGAQHAAFGAHVSNIDAAIAQTPGAQAFDANGLRAVAHLGGVDGMQKFIASGGHYDPADSNGTHLSDYYLKFGAGGHAALQTAFGSPHGPAGPPVAPAGVATRTGGVDVAGPGAPTAPAAPGEPQRETYTVGPDGAAQKVLVPAQSDGVPVPGPPAAPAVPALLPPTQQNAAGPAPSPPPQLMPAASAQPPGVQPTAPQGFQPPRADAAQPVAPVTDENGLTAADHTALAGMKQAFKSQLNPNGAQLLQAEIDKRQATNRALSVAAWNAANPNIRATPVQGVGPNGEPGTWMVQGKNIAGFIPSTTRPATADYQQQETAYKADIPVVQAASASGRVSQASALQLNELADVIKGQKTGGPVPEFRAKVAAMLEFAGASKETQLAFTGMTGTESQILEKLATATLGQNAKADLGTNIGVESLHVYAGANPGRHMLETANISVTNQIRVARAMIDSYTTGLQQHFNKNQASFQHGGSYEPTSNFDAKFQAQNNPQIGAAAIGILNGDKYDSWAARVSPQEAAYAVQLASRIDPNAQVPVADGTRKPAKDILAHPTLPAPR